MKTMLASRFIPNQVLSWSGYGCLHETDPAKNR